MPTPRIAAAFFGLLLPLGLAGCFELPLDALDARPSDRPFEAAELYDPQHGATIRLQAAADGYRVTQQEDGDVESEAVLMRVWEIAPSVFVSASPEARRSPSPPEVALAGIFKRDGERVTFYPACATDAIVALAAEAGAASRKEGWLTHCRFDTVAELTEFARALTAQDLDAPLDAPLRDQTIDLEIVRLVE